MPPRTRKPIPILDALYRGDMETFARLLATTPSVMHKQVFTKAVQYNCTEAVQLLFDHGLSPMTNYNQVATMLMHQRDTRVLRLLLQRDDFVVRPSMMQAALQTGTNEAFLELAQQPIPLRTNGKAVFTANIHGACYKHAVAACLNRWVGFQFVDPVQEVDRCVREMSQAICHLLADETLAAKIDTARTKEVIEFVLQLQRFQVAEARQLVATPFAQEHVSEDLRRPYQ